MEAVIQEPETAFADQSTLVRISYYPNYTCHINHATSMTLGHVYDLDLKKNEMLIKEVIIQAQGEVPLISFILLVYTNER